jgi:hypothetical protein
MQTNGLQLVRAFTAVTGGGTQDTSPNEVAGIQQANFDLIIEGEAGDAVGDAEMAYTLYLSAASTSGGVTAFARQRLAERVADGSFGWSATPTKNDGYLLRRVITVNASDFPEGDVYQFTITLKTKNGILNTTKSNDFATI